VALGACFFMLSDSLLATNRFVQPLPLAQVGVLATYYAAQAFIVHGMVWAYASADHSASGWRAGCAAWKGEAFAVLRDAPHRRVRRRPKGALNTCGTRQQSASVGGRHGSTGRVGPRRSSSRAAKPRAIQCCAQVLRPLRAPAGCG
jgi:hypothetical protein